MTIDLEWCPTPIIQDTIQLLDEFDISATLFSTHNDKMQVEEHERALHPNFFDQEDDDEVVISELYDMFPMANGIRSHGLYIHSRLRSAYPESITYESNYIQYLEPNISPHWMHQQIVQFPIYFMDDMWLRTNDNHEPVDTSTLVNKEGLKVFDFHPVHVYLNTSTITEYEHAKQHYDSPEKLETLRTDEYGVRDLFTALLAEIDARQLSVAPLGEIMESFARENPYDSSFSVN